MPKAKAAPQARNNMRHTVTLTPQADRYVRKVYSELIRQAKGQGPLPTFSSAISSIVEEHAQMEREPA